MELTLTVVTGLDTYIKFCSTVVMLYHSNAVSLQYGWTPLTMASGAGNNQLVELLIRYKADVNMKTDGVRDTSTLIRVDTQ